MCFLMEEWVPEWYISNIQFWGCLVPLNNFSPKKKVNVLKITACRLHVW